MKIPSGSNLEILAQLPEFLSDLARKSSELEKKVKALESKKKEKSYDDSELRSELKNAVTMCKRDDSTYRDLAEQIDIVKQWCAKSIESCKHDDKVIVEQISKISDRIKFIESAAGVK